MEELSNITDQINALIVGKPRNKDKFCEHIIKVIAEAERYGQYLCDEWQKAKRSKLLEKTKRPELMQYDESRDKEKWTWWTANQNDWAWGESVYFSSIFENNEYVAFYIEGKLKPDPLAYLYSMIWGSVGQDYKGFELLDYQFILLAIIHDVQNWQAGRERIYFNPLQDNTLPDRLCRAAWRTLEKQRDSGRVQQTIKTALRGVKAELDKTTSSGKAGETSGGKIESRSIDSQNKHEDIVELKPNFCGIGLNINALIRKREWGTKIKNLLKAFIYRKSQPK